MATLSTLDESQQMAPLPGEPAEGPKLRGTSVKTFVILTRFLWRCRKGTTALELALVAPFLFAMLLGIIQFGMLFYLQNSMVNAARETVRALAIGSITSTEAQAYADQVLIDWGVTFTVAPQMPDPLDPTDNSVVVNISAPMSEAVIVDPFGYFYSGTLMADAIMRQQF